MGYRWTPQKKQADVEAQAPPRLDRVVNPKRCFVIILSLGHAAVRMLVDPANRQDVEQVRALQDALTVSQQSPGTFEIPNWDEASLKKVQTALLQLGETISDTRRMFGAKEDQVDPVRRLVGT